MKIKFHLKAGKQRRKASYILLSCLFVLLIGYQNCKNNNKESSSERKESSLDVTITPGSNTETQATVTWQWECTQDSCTYAHEITTTASKPEFSDDQFSTEKTATKSFSASECASPPCTYYLHVQAIASGSKSEIRSVSAVLGPQSSESSNTPEITSLINTNSQIAIGSYHICFLFKSGEVKCWGGNSFGQLGLNDGNSNNNKKVIGDQANEVKNLSAIHLGKKAIAIAASPGADMVNCSNQEHYARFPGDNAIYVTQCNREHQQSADRQSCVKKKECSKANSRRQGYHTCAILEGGELKCWGRNDYGQLGLGSADHKGDQANEIQNLSPVDLGMNHKAKAIALGSHHTCAILNNDNVKCWGLNDQGQLGYDSSDATGLGIRENQMGANLAIVGGNTFKVKAITAGHAHTCAITKDDNVKCWGRNNYGQLGLDAGKVGDNIRISDQTGELASLSDIDLPDKAKSIIAGSYHTCAILQNDKVTCWGRNDYGQLGIGNKTTIGDDANEMGALQTVELGSDSKVKAVVAGLYHTCVLSKDNHMKCFGNNRHGQLGIGSNTHIGDGPDEMGDHLEAVPAGASRSVASISAGGHNSCFVLDNEDTKCWGSNHFGQLGQGNKTYRNSQGRFINRDLGDNEAISRVNPIPLQINGQCGTERNTCLEGMPNDNAIDDTPTRYKWQCEGSPGGQNADCSAAISS